MKNFDIYEFIENQFVDESNIKCYKCQNKKYFYNNKFYYCSCEEYICPLCIKNHDKKHNHIEYKSQFLNCNKHGKAFVSYCKTCQDNLCPNCEGAHLKHKVDYMKKLKPNEKIIDEKINDFNEMNNRFESCREMLQLLKLYINKYIAKYINYLENYKKLSEIIMSKADNLKNYESIKNLKRFNQKKICKEINELLEENISNKLQYILNLDNNISFSNSINLYYHSTSDRYIKLFDRQFIENNKDNCFLIINKNIYPLTEIYYVKKNTNKEKSKLNNDLVETNIIFISDKPLVNMSYMFYECSSLIFIEFNQFDFSKVTTMSNMFKECSNLKKINGLIVSNNVRNISHMFDKCVALDNFEFMTYWNIFNVRDLNYLFFRCSNIQNLPDISNWNTHNTKNMSNLFNGCFSLLTLPDISNWNVSNVLDFSYMFSGCSALSSLPDISNWNISNSRDLNNMFNGCNELSSLPDISNWNLEKVKNISGIFSDCRELKSLPDISKWNTNRVINMSSVFSGCESLSIIPDISKWNTNNVKNMNSLFYYCISLTS